MLTLELMLGSRKAELMICSCEKNWTSSLSPLIDLRQFIFDVTHCTYQVPFYYFIAYLPTSYVSWYRQVGGNERMNTL